MAHLLGTADGVSYTDWREAMLRKEEEFEQNGSMAGQKLADEFHGVCGYTENALPATALHQTFRGSGFRVEELYREDGGPEIQGLGNRVWVEDEQAHRLVTFRIEGCTPLGGAVI